MARYSGVPGARVFPGQFFLLLVTTPIATTGKTPVHAPKRSAAAEQKGCQCAGTVDTHNLLPVSLVLVNQIGSCAIFQNNITSLQPDPDLQTAIVIRIAKKMFRKNRDPILIRKSMSEFAFQIDPRCPFPAL